MKKAIIGSLLLSILHSILFYGQDLGISVLLFAVVSVFLLVQFLKKHNRIKNKNAIYLTIPIILLSSTYFLFNNTFFSILNMIVIPLLLATMIIWACVDTFKLRELLSKSLNIIVGSLEFIPNAFTSIKKAFKMKDFQREIKHKKIKLIGIGILCSLPLLFIIIGLLIEADGLFADLFTNLFNNIMFIFTSKFIIQLIGRIILIALVFIYLVCILYNIININSSFNKEYKVKDIFKINIDSTIINTVLTIINAVYLIFTGIQCVYLYSYIFSNATLKTGLNLAQYARQGFFQLMFITIINFIIILLTNENQKKQETKSKYTKIMNVVMCVFTIIIAVSAFMRMHLYETEYGYTFLRLMVYFALIAEVIAIIPTIYYIIKGKINLLKTYLIVGIATYVLVNFINIDYQIAKNNINRIGKEGTRKIDIEYLLDNLETDAVPEIVKLYGTIGNREEKRKINNYLYYIYNDVKQDTNIQEWNLSKQHAKKILEPLNLKYQNYSGYDTYTNI